MPRVKRPTVKYRPRPKRTKPRLKRKRDLPRLKIRTSPLSRPNHYNFMRSFAFSLDVGVADPGNRIYMNTDNKAQIIKLRVKFADLPSDNEFGSLFNQFQITSMKSVFQPYFSSNQPFSMGNATVTNDYGIAIPNFQCFVLPENYTIDNLNLDTMNITQIDDWLNQTMRKGMYISPGRTKVFFNKRPALPVSDVPVEKPTTGTYGIQTGSMKRAGYLDYDLRTTEHYGLQVLILRTDREVINPLHNGSTIFQHMGWRVTNQVYFRTRKVQ